MVLLSPATEPARTVPAPPAAEAIAAAPPVASAPPSEPRAGVSAPAAPVAIAPAAPVAIAPPAAVVAGVAPEEAARPPEIHDGDVNQNTYVTNIRQGDVYLIQLQQLAMLQYMQLLGASSGVAAPPRRARAALPQRTPFPSGIVNPDNPWGFQFMQPNLVR